MSPQKRVKLTLGLLESIFVFSVVCLWDPPSIMKDEYT